ncbi:hypothetical protein [Mycobacterium kyorinense]|uniref:hypothetical protein n=1 Tax=Mycobacterium kyorinense TaxID=487514 RepID=UPI001F3F7D20|nr:hypothetical protein [Mycobacterium kyorinense]
MVSPERGTPRPKVSAQTAMPANSAAATGGLPVKRSLSRKTAAMAVMQTPAM